MKLAKRFLSIATIVAFSSLFVACGGLLDWLSAPYGYVQDSAGTAVVGATVTVYRDSVSSTNKVQQSATTGSDGYFSLQNKVDTVGGTYVVVVEAPAGSSLQFENYTVKVPTDGYLYTIGTIKAIGAKYSVSGKVINVRDYEKAVGYTIPTTGTVELRKFGETTATATATIGTGGTYSVSGIESGSYLVTFKKSITDTATWVGIPVSIEVAGGDITELGALVYKDVPATAIVLILTWDNLKYDIDTHAYVGPVGSATRVDKTINVSGNKVTWERDVVATTTGTGAAADGSNVIASGAYPVETTVIESLASGTELRFWAKGFQYDTSATSISGLDDGANSVLPAGVKLYAMFNGIHYGTWFAPLNTSEVAVAMAQVVGNSDTTMTIGTYGGVTPKSIVPMSGSDIPVIILE